MSIFLHQNQESLAQNALRRSRHLPLLRSYPWRERAWNLFKLRKINPNSEQSASLTVRRFVFVGLLIVVNNQQVKFFIENLWHRSTHEWRFWENRFVRKSPRIIITWRHVIKSFAILYFCFDIILEFGQFVAQRPIDGWTFSITTWNRIELENVTVYWWTMSFGGNDKKYCDKNDQNHQKG